MFRPHPTPTRSPAARRGAILILVLALLTIFSVIAITFVFYASNEADIARIHREAQGGGDPNPPDATDALNQFLGGWIYDVYDTGPDLLNALRGHSLAATEYSRAAGAVIPFNGVGTLHEVTPLGVDRARVANHTVIGGNVYDPEFLGFRTAAQLGTSPFALPGKMQYPKNAPYTYADSNNLFLAALSPATGEVVVPSFYRSWQFRGAGQPPTATGLEPPFAPPAGNPNWTTPQGRFLILRPRPADNVFDSGDGRGPVSDFPYVPPNADGTYTGDVQNLPGGFTQVTMNISGTPTPVYVARNDSIWIDIGLPPRVWNGKRVKPLVAALIVDMDGRLNLSAHGNLRTGTSHTSYAGYGPWEVNLQAALSQPEVLTLLQARYAGTPNAISRGGLTAQAYGSSPSLGSPVRLPGYSLVNWDGTGTAVQPMVSPPSYATGNPLTSTALFGGTGFFDDNVTVPGRSQFHPSLFNPNEWSSNIVAGVPRVFSLADFKRLNARFAGPADMYNMTDFAKLPAPPIPSLLPVTAGGPAYRTDYSHARRTLFTTQGAVLDRHGISPGPSGGALMYNFAYPQNTGTPSPTRSFTYSTAGQPYLGTPNTTPRLAPVNLNRTLADYRNLNAAPNVAVNGMGQITAYTPQPLGPNNVANAAQAWVDRQNLARDIFARLIVSTGALSPSQYDMVGNLTSGVDEKTGNVIIPIGLTPPAPGQPDNGYEALRHLAQIAVNMVDAIDNDDISTPFVWNPATLNMAMMVQNGLLTMIPDYTTLQTLYTLAATQADGRVVYGFEKPRLTINEAYSEIANDPQEKQVGANGADKPKFAARVRFWVELLNPTSPAGNAPIGNGQAQLYYDSTLDGIASSYSPYRLQIGKNDRGGGVTALGQYPPLAVPVPGNLLWPTNTTGNLMFTPEIQFDFHTAGVNRIVQPNNGTYDPIGNPAAGVVLVAPSIPAPNAGVGPLPFEFQPPVGLPANPRWQNAIVSPLLTGGAMAPVAPVDAMEYFTPNNVPPTIAELQGMMYKRHVVVLQRLADPYQFPNDPSTPTYNPALPPNPYLTVDYMDWVPSWDAVNRSQTDTTAARKDKSIDPNGYDLIASRVAVGKIHPYAGYAAPGPVNNGLYYVPTLAQFNTNAQFSCVLQQSPAPANMAEPQHTFGRHNGRAIASPLAATLPPADTLVTPFDWLVQFDRPLVNQLELLHVQTLKTQDVTQYFLSTDGAGNLIRDYGLAPWINPYPAAAVPPNSTRLYRALDLLRVKPWGFGMPPGGKVNGMININTVQDVRVLQGLLDPQGGNMFTATDVLNLWGSGTMMFGTRTVNWAAKPTYDPAFPTANVPIPGPTIDDMDPASVNVPNAVYDRPFKPLGIGEFAANANPASAFAYAAGSGIQNTILRPGVNNLPAAWVTSSGQTHMYQQAEAARKMFNNVTTVSNTFAVYLTVGFFEIRKDGAGNPALVYEGPGNTLPRYILGREAYRDVPGDLRQQYFAVVDRNNLAIPTTGVGPVASSPNVLRPFFTNVEAVLPPAPPGQPNWNLVIAASGMRMVGAMPIIQVFVDGHEMGIAASIPAGTTQIVGGATLTSSLALGAGDAQEVVIVNQVTWLGNGLAQLSISPPTRPHVGGECLSNVWSSINVPPVAMPRLGNPGPQPAFDYRIPAYQPVVPFVSKLLR